MNKSIKIFIALTLTFSLTVNAQNYSFKHLNVIDGLAQSQVSCLLQARNGTIWVGTLGGGISIFDGISFKNITARDGLSSNIIYSLFENHKGEIVASTYQGVSVISATSVKVLTIDKKQFNDKIRKVVQLEDGSYLLGSDKGLLRFDGINFSYFSNDQLLKDAIIKDIFLDNNRIWIASSNLGLLYIENSIVSKYKPFYDRNITEVNKIIKDRNNRIITATENGIVIIESDKLILIAKKNGLTDDYVNDVISGEGDDLWAATDHGLSRISNSIITNYDQKNGMSSNTVWSLLLDTEGNLWAGTYRGGLNRFKEEYFLTYTSLEGLCDNVTRAICEDSNGNIILGSYRGGLEVFNGKNFKCLSVSDGLPDNFVLSLFKDSKNRIWTGTFSGACYYYKGVINSVEKLKALKGKIIRSFTEDKNGLIWIGTNSKGIYLWDGEKLENITTRNGLNSNEIMNLYTDSKGSVWIATTNGINYWDQISIHNFNLENSLPESTVYTIAESKDSTMVFGTYGKGLILAKPEVSVGKYSCRIINADSGLVSDYLVSLVFDNENNLWIGTELGVNLFKYSTYLENQNINIDFFGPEDGFKGIECMHNASYKDTKGNIWLGTLYGTNKYDPSLKISLSNSKEPYTNIIGVSFPESIKKINSFSDTVSNVTGLPLNLHIPFSKNKIRIDYNGICFTNPGKVLYRHKLEGYNNEYSQPSKDRFVTYSNLSPGNYTFSVISCNNSGFWNTSPATYKFVITPRIWQRSIFWFLVISLFFFLVWVLFKARTAAIRRKNEILEEKVSERTAELVIARDKAEESDRLKTAFLSNISHEIRTPLNAILGFSELLNNTTNTQEDIRFFIDQMEIGKDDLLDLIENVVFASKIETRQFVEIKKEFNLNDCLNKLVSDSKKLINRSDKSHIDYLTHIESTKDISITTDENNIIMALRQLISNAIKYTDSGKIELVTKLIENSEIEFYIRDTGTGIDENEFEKIFDRFYKVESNPNKLFRGAGIGLTVVKGIAEAMGGKVWVDSKIGEGSTFYFSIPVHVREIAPTLHQPQTSVSNIIEKWGSRNILIAEDVDTNFEYLDKALNFSNISKFHARNGHEAIEIMKPLKLIWSLWISLCHQWMDTKLLQLSKQCFLQFL
ncbi:MAG: two-component regulator propeller domain-containing protein [Bacteroidales bacterium]|nr:two-component regulator propeller domain-containing protein [Bacteroidales bacterium]